MTKTCLLLCKKSMFHCGSEDCVKLQAQYREIVPKTNKPNSASSPQANTEKKPNAPTTTRSSTASEWPTREWWNSIGAKDTQEQNRLHQLELLTQLDTVKKKSVTNDTHTNA